VENKSIMNKIEHIGIAVKNIDDSIKVYQKLLNKDCYKIEEVESEGVLTAFFKIGTSKIELLQAIREDSPISKFIEKKGVGVHHIAFEVVDIYKEIERLEKEGFQLIHTTPKDGADHKLIAFLHPKSTDGILVELCQEK
jgi:methylmalonyl-CoA/ethylmalonyl-CoA epimerase